MALWTGLAEAATVAQLVGADVGGLISMIMQATLTARHNKRECEQLARRVLMIAQLLPHVHVQDMDPEVAQPLAGLGDTLRDAHELVVSCQQRNLVYQFVMAGRTAERFREVQSKIDSYLILFPMISHISITRRLQEIFSLLVPDDSSGIERRLSQLQEPTEVAHDVLLPHGIQEFRLAEILVATNNFALDTVISAGGFGSLYRGRLHDGLEVAIKRINNHEYSAEAFNTEIDILSRLRHKHIVNLLGVCVSKDKRLLTSQRKESEMLIVYEYMENGTLFNHLHLDHGSSMLSPVTVSWKMRIDVLLGVSHAIEHLHCHASTQIIHQDIKSSNILFNASWVPRVSDFGLSVTCDMASEESSLEVSRFVGTYGYLAPEYIIRGSINLSSDVYSLGVVMLEVLTGKKAIFQGEKEMNVDLVSFAVPITQAGNIEKLLDRRPTPEPTARQLQVLKRVAQIARCCVKLNWKDRPTISDIVANLKMAHELICRDEAGSAVESGLWPFLEKVEEFQDSPRGSCSNVSWAGSQHSMESEVLEEGR